MTALPMNWLGVWISLQFSVWQIAGRKRLQSLNFHCHWSQIGCDQLAAVLTLAALGYLQPEIQARCFPLSVVGDGNCFFRSLSLLLFCNQNHHKELRVRTAMAMALNQDLFLNGENWRAEHEQLSSDEILTVSVMTSACSITPETNPGLVF